MGKLLVNFIILAGLFLMGYVLFMRIYEIFQAQNVQPLAIEILKNMK